MDKDLELFRKREVCSRLRTTRALKFENLPRNRLSAFLLEISKAGIANAEPAGAAFVEETGYGNVEHKTLKKFVCADDVVPCDPADEDGWIVSEDQGEESLRGWPARSSDCCRLFLPQSNVHRDLQGVDRAQGPECHRFQPHPSAREIASAKPLASLGGRGTGRGAKGVISCIKVPPIEGTQELMRTERTALILATGGPAGEAAYSAGAGVRRRPGETSFLRRKDRADLTEGRARHSHGEMLR